MICLNCKTDASQEELFGSCRSCGRKLENGAVICPLCSQTKQLCERCGAPLRIKDFPGAFAIKPKRLDPSAERKIVAMLIQRHLH